MVTSDGLEFHGVSRALAGVSTTLPPCGGEPLDRRLVVGDAGHHDVALLGVGLLADHHEVAVDDAGVDHRVAPDPSMNSVPVPVKSSGSG